MVITFGLKAMNENESIYVKSKPAFMGLHIRNKELLILFGTSLISVILMQVTTIGYISLALFTFIVFFIGRKRGAFVNSGLRYTVYKDKIELHKGSELYREYILTGTTISVERTVFGDDIVFKKSISNYLGSDSVAGFVNDLGRNSYEFLIYNCPNTEEVIQYIKDENNNKKFQ